MSEPHHPAIPSSDPLHPDIVYSLIIDGDLGRLNEDQRVAYYVDRCQALGISAGEQPFSLVRLSGKMVLYLNKVGAAALTRVNQLSVEVVSKGWDGEAYVVQARATTPTGRYAEDIGVVDMDDEREKAAEAKLKGKKGEVISRPNAMMKAVTKAKRRSIIAVCGAGLLDESELDGVRGAERASISQIRDEAPESDPFMTGKLASKAHAASARCAKIAAAKTTDDKLVTPLAVWEAACAKFKLPPLPDGSTPKIDQLRKSLAFPICELIKTWESKLEPEIIEGDFTEREPGEDRDIDGDPDVDDAWNADDPPGAP